MLNVNSVHSVVKYRTSLLIPLFPKLVFLLLSVPHSCASHSTTYIYGVAANLFEEHSVCFWESGAAEDSVVISNTVRFALGEKVGEDFHS